MGRASKDKRDIYYRKAKEEGYRARSAYKLLQIHEEFNILSDAEITVGAVDLCAAPGSWSQVLASHFKRIQEERVNQPQQQPHDNCHDRHHPHVKPRIVAVDLQEMAPIDGVCILQGDITSEATANKIIALLNAPAEDGNDGEKGDDVRGGAAASGRGGGDAEEDVPAKKQKQEDLRGELEEEEEGAPPRAQANVRKADIVVCDGAPDVTGMHELDEYLQHQLLLAALTITTCVLRTGGAFVTKMFRGPNTPFLVAKAELFFSQVRVVKPKSSRNASMESFLVCQGFTVPTGYVPRFLNTGSSHQHHDDTQHEEEDEKKCRVHTLEGGAHAVNPCSCDGQGDCYTPDAPRMGFSTAAAPRPPATAATDPLLQHHLLPFLSCGDLSGFDADMCYNREAGSAVLAPVQPPLEAPYLKPKKT